MEKLLDGFSFLEAPRVDVSGHLYFTDIVIGGAFRLSPDGKLDHFLESRKMIGGLAINQDGRLVLSGRGGLVLFDMETHAVEPLFDRIDGQPVSSVNDIQPDGLGGVYAGMIDSATQDSLDAGSPKPMVLVRADRTAEIVGPPIQVSNGIGLSADGSKVYQVETAKGVMAFDRSADGSLSGGRLLVEHPNSDGMAVDAEDGIWVAAVGGGAVKRFTPDGKFDRQIDVPDPLVASVTFGGEDLRDMYIVTGSRFDLGDPPTGKVYRVRSDVPGLPTPLTRF